MLLGLLLPFGPPTPAEALQAPGSREQIPSENGPELEAVLAGMDEAANRFRSVVANLEYTKVTVIVNDSSTERGKLSFEKAKGKTRVMIAVQEPAEKYVLFAHDKVSIYRPKIAEVEVYSLAQRQDLLEQFLLLGFGTAGQELQKAYRVSWRGEETLNGQPVVHLELVPKSAKVAAQIQRIELWISPQGWQPLQQKFWEPSGDYLIARYRDLKHNVSIPGKSFQLPLRGKVRTVQPQLP